MAKARTTLLTSTLEPSVDWVLWLDVDLVEAPKSLISDLLTFGGAGIERERRPSRGRKADANTEVNKWKASEHDIEAMATDVPSRPADEVDSLGGDDVQDQDEDELDMDMPPLADVITPNIMRRLGRGWVQGYDLNNWSETPKSLKMKAKLPAERMLWEGNRGRPTYRNHLAENWIKPNVSTSWDDRTANFTALSEVTTAELYSRLFTHTSDDDGVNPDGTAGQVQRQRSNLFDPTSDAYIGRTQELDGVGGVATLVRAETHRFGAIFPSWLEDHEVETEGFGVLARKAGARVVGLPNYLVMHKSSAYSSPSRSE